MPPVMRDAIEACRALSIPYLWIDALCIIQDDSDDWNRESEVMGLIFQGAFITFCAIASTSCRQGFLGGKLHKMQMGYQSTIQETVSGSYTIIDRGSYDYGRHGLRSPLEVELSRSPWNDRGWTFQEEASSKRLIYFGRDMVHYKCGMREVSENGYEEGYRLMVPKTVLDILQKAMRERSGEAMYTMFRDASARYAGRTLTFESDRLPAISGLAKYVSQVTGDKYLAGLWEKDLHYGLLWSGYKPEHPMTLHKSLQTLLDSHAVSSSTMPTWTWASRPGFFEHRVGTFSLDEGPVKSEVRVVHATTRLAGSNPFGLVNGGELTVFGRLVPIPSDFELKQQDMFDTEIWCVYNGQSYAAHCQLDWVVGSLNPYDDWDDVDAGSDDIKTISYPSKGLIMLLVSSTCGGRSYSLWSSASTTDDDTSSQRSWYSVERGDGQTTDMRMGDEGEEEEEEEEGMDSETSEANYGSCDRPTSDRHAWGLIIHESKEAGKYYRVGIFTSRVREGAGMRMFATAKFEKITLI